ncbi:uncharacterized protein LOC121602180 [Anopheles merus]|uniref:uncharacterized protein LOC121602180 n=1 Tax=Anopheles merus TaxID=30066 RepID=UPI001BE44FE0|nr:uncharacterized protein LOC121602180 [Anopheles merus]
MPRPTAECTGDEHQQPTVVEHQTYATTSACNTMAEVRTTNDFKAQMTRKVDDLSRQLNEFMRQSRQSDRFRTHPRSQPPTPPRRAAPVDSATTIAVLEEQHDPADILARIQPPCPRARVNRRHQYEDAPGTSDRK